MSAQLHASSFAQVYAAAMARCTSPHHQAPNPTLHLPCKQRVLYCTTALKLSIGCTAAGGDVGQALNDLLDAPVDNPSARSALAAIKPSPTSQLQHPAELSQAASNLPHKTSPSTSDAHPHLLFLKTGGGSTVAQPKHQLTPQQLQMLADGTGTLEGLAAGPYSPLQGTIKPVIMQSGQEGMQPGLQGSSLQPRQQEPLGIATVVLDGGDDSQQLASLFTPRHDQAAATLSQAADDKTGAQRMFSSSSEQESTSTGKASVRPSAKSLQGVNLDQPEAHDAGYPALEAAASRREDFTNSDSLRWLDEVAAERAERVAQHLKDLQQQDQEAATKGPWQLQREQDHLNGQLPMGKGSLLEAERHPAVGLQRPSLSRAVLLTLVLSIAAEDTEVRLGSAMLLYNVGNHAMGHAAALHMLCYIKPCKPLSSSHSNTPHPSPPTPPPPAPLKSTCLTQRHVCLLKSTSPSVTDKAKVIGRFWKS